MQVKVQAHFVSMQTKNSCIWQSNLFLVDILLAQSSGLSLSLSMIQLLHKLIEVKINMYETIEFIFYCCRMNHLGLHSYLTLGFSCKLTQTSERFHSLQLQNCCCLLVRAHPITIGCHEILTTGSHGASDHLLKQARECPVGCQKGAQQHQRGG